MIMRTDAAYAEQNMRSTHKMPNVSTARHADGERGPREGRVKGRQFEAWGMHEGRRMWGSATCKPAGDSAAEHARIERCKPGVIDCDWKPTGNLNADAHAKRRRRLHRQAERWGGRMDAAD